MQTTEEIAVGFYMWMQENGHDHNIKSRVEAKFKEYHRAELLKLNKSDVISSVCKHKWKYWCGSPQNETHRCVKCGAVG